MYKKIAVLLAAAVVSFPCGYAFAQDNSSFDADLQTARESAEEEKPREINVERTERHREFFDFPAEIAPPEGYNFKKSAAGATDAARKTAVEGAVVHTPYDGLLDELAGERAKRENIEIKARYSFIWNGYRTEMLKLFQKSGKAVVGKWTLIVDRGAGDECWIISGVYDANNQAASQETLDTIKSAWWLPRDEAETGGALPVGVDTTGTPFRIAGFRQGALIYTKDGKIPTGEEDGAMFVLSSLAGQYVSADDRRGFATERIYEVEPGKELEIAYQTEEEINGRPAVITAAYTGGEEKTLIYQAMLFRAMKTTALVGIAKGNFEENLDCFRRLAASYDEG